MFSYNKTIQLTYNINGFQWSAFAEFVYGYQVTKYQGSTQYIIWGTPFPHYAIFGGTTGGIFKGFKTLGMTSEGFGKMFWSEHSAFKQNVLTVPFLFLFSFL